MGAAMTWNAAGCLTQITGNTNSTLALPTGGVASYTYLADSSRRTKTVGGRTTTYHYNNGLLLSETRSGGGSATETLRYYYDCSGKLTTFTYQSGSGAETAYFPAYNGQGDVIALYLSDTSTLVGTYEYDLWGKPVSVTPASSGSDPNGILAKNPFRYRGYYYDGETGLYYLNARYYDPTVRRFISADNAAYLGVNGTIDSYNLYAYCNSNPVNMEDTDGNWPTVSQIFTCVAVVACGVAIGAAIVVCAPATVAVAAGVGGAVIGSTAAMSTATTVGVAACGIGILSAGAAVATEDCQITFSKKDKNLGKTVTDPDKEENSPRKMPIGKQKGNTPRGNKHQNKQPRKILKEKAPSKYYKYKEQIHHEISGKWYGYQELMEEIESLLELNGDL